jgi:hypothetical protein
MIFRNIFKVATWEEKNRFYGNNITDNIANFVSINVAHLSDVSGQPIGPILRVQDLEPLLRR